MSRKLTKERDKVVAFYARRQRRGLGRGSSGICGERGRTRSTKEQDADWPSRSFAELAEFELHRDVGAAPITTSPPCGSRAALAYLAVGVCR
jgi:hypothetical protein